MGRDLLLGDPKREMQSHVAAFSRETAFLPTVTESRKVGHDLHYNTSILYLAVPVDQSIGLELDR